MIINFRGILLHPQEQLYLRECWVYNLQKFSPDCMVYKGFYTERKLCTIRTRDNMPQINWTWHTLWLTESSNFALCESINWGNKLARAQQNLQATCPMIWSFLKWFQSLIRVSGLKRLSSSLMLECKLLWCQTNVCKQKNVNSENDNSNATDMSILKFLLKRCRKTLWINH